MFVASFIFLCVFTSSCDVELQAACGITNKPKEQILDIDAGDVGNELAAVEYIEDIYKFYKLVEVSYIMILFILSLFFQSFCLCCGLM